MNKTLLLLLLNGNVWAADSCQYTWELTGKGINLGKSIDSFKNTSKIELHSIYQPSKFVTMFGVKKVLRTVSFENNKMFFRKEEVLGKHNENIIWNLTNNGIWEKSANSVKIDEIAIPSNNKIIDSTIFPYLASLNLLDLNQKSQEVTVLSKGTPYTAIVNIEEFSNNLTTHKVSFITEKKNGTVFLNSKKEPIELTFTDENGTFYGKVVENSCSNKF